jgi:hypothetical protein
MRSSARPEPPLRTTMSVKTKNVPINMMRILIVCWSDGDRPGHVHRRG